MSLQHNRRDAAAVPLASPHSFSHVRNIRSAELIRFSFALGAQQLFLTESFEPIPVTGLILVCLKNETQPTAERDMHELISKQFTERDRQARWPIA